MSVIFNTDDGLYSIGPIFGAGLGCDNAIDRVFFPNKLTFFNNHQIISFHMGDYHNVIHTNEGVFVFGYENTRQLCSLGNIDFKKPQKLTFFNNYEILSVQCGSYYTIIHTTDGLFGFGCNGCGGLGLGDTYKIQKPTKLDFFDGLFVFSVHCLYSRTFVFTNDGLYVFGANHFGQLGLNDNNDRKYPTKLDFFNDYEIISIGGSYTHTIIQTKTGIFVFGENSFGQLGLGDNNNRNTPTKLNFFDDHEIISINCVNMCYSMINTTKGLYFFGKNSTFKKFYNHQNIPIKCLENYQIISLYRCPYYEHYIINTTDGWYALGSLVNSVFGSKNSNEYNLMKINFNYKVVPLINKWKKENIKSTSSFV